VSCTRADDDGVEPATVAWQASDRGPWTATHETLDRGRTTRCGLTVPAVVACADAWSDTKGRCKRCLKHRA